MVKGKINSGEGNPGQLPGGSGICELGLEGQDRIRGCKDGSVGGKGWNRSLWTSEIT